MLSWASSSASDSVDAVCTVSPAGALLAAPDWLCVGTMARVKPRRAASASRRDMWPTWRISPPRPISPHTTKSLGAGLLITAETSAMQRPKSLPGSLSHTPPTTEAKTSCCERLIPARRSSTASSMASRPGSRPCALRRGGTLPLIALVSACTSTSSGR